jgi:hypothetical protein
MTLSPTLTSSGTRLPLSSMRRGDLLGVDLLDDDAILERLDGDRHWMTSF